MSQGILLERSGVERVSPREPSRLVGRDHGDARGRPRSEGAGALRTQKHGPEPTAESRPVARAESDGLSTIVGDDADAALPHHHSAHALQDRGEARGRSREQAPACVQLEVKAPARHESGRVRSEQPRRHDHLVALPGDRERLHQADAVDRQVRPERHDPCARVFGEVRREAQPLEIHGGTRAVKDQPRLRRIVVSGEAHRGSRRRVSLRAGGMASPPRHGARAIEGE